MKKYVLYGLCAILVSAAIYTLVHCFITQVITLDREIKEERAFTTSMIGKKVIIQGDTLLIVNYQDGGFGKPRGFMLSNGIMIDNDLLKGDLVVEK